MKFAAHGVKGTVNNAGVVPEEEPAEGCHQRDNAQAAGVCALPERG